MNILVTGASGFVGRKLIPVLIAHNHRVTALTRNPKYQPDNCRTVIGDISKITDSVFNLIDVETVIHLAGRAHVMHDTNINPFLAYQEINVHQSTALAKQAIDAGVKRFIFISSVKVLGEYTSLNAFSEESICVPEDDYGKSKLEAENSLKVIFKGTNTELVIIRPPLIYGAGVKANFKNLIRLCSKPIPLPLGAINNKRSLIYLENLIDLIALCCSHPKAANQTFLVSDDDDVSTTDLIKAIKKGLSKPNLLLSIPQQWLVKLLNLLGKHRLATRLCGDLQIDITKAKTLLNWTPPFTFEQGIQKTIDAYQQHD